MQKVWFFMIVASCLMLIFNSPDEVLKSLTISSENSLTLLLKLLGIYAIWLGILEIVEKSGISIKLSNLLSPLTNWLFGKIDSKTKMFITMNISTNMLGLGNACTPMGINAMKELDKQNKTNRASHQMIMLMIINATSVQLLPTTVLSLRAAFGSVAPSNIIFPSLIATFASTLFGVLGVKLMIKLTKGKK